MYNLVLIWFDLLPSALRVVQWSEIQRTRREDLRTAWSEEERIEWKESLNYWISFHGRKWNAGLGGKRSIRPVRLVVFSSLSLHLFLSPALSFSYFCSAWLILLSSIDCVSVYLLLIFCSEFTLCRDITRFCLHSYPYSKICSNIRRLLILALTCQKCPARNPHRQHSPWWPGSVPGSADGRVLWRRRARPG